MKVSSFRHMVVSKLPSFFIVKVTFYLDFRRFANKKSIDLPFLV